MEKLIFPVSVTKKEQLSGVFIFDFEKSALLAHPLGVILTLFTRDLLGDLKHDNIKTMRHQDSKTMRQ